MSRTLRLFPLTALLLAAMIGAASAETLVFFDGQVARLPRPRPQTAAPPELSVWAGVAESLFREARADLENETSQGDDSPAATGDAARAIDNLAPLPRPRPRPQSAPPVLALLAPPPLVAIPTFVEADAACPARLRSLDVTFSAKAPIDPGGECNVDHPLLVTSLGSGVAIEPEAILNCRTAELLALWVKEALLPAALERFATAPTGIVHGSTYVCRPRNNVTGAKLSEHAHANAVDVSAIRFADRATIGIGVSEPGSSEALFEAEIGGAACESFKTVLGPGSDAAHAEHFHFDMAFRRGGYRLCELGAPTTVGAP